MSRYYILQTEKMIFFFICFMLATEKKFAMTGNLYYLNFFLWNLIQLVLETGGCSILVATEGSHRLEFYHLVRLRWDICQSIGFQSSLEQEVCDQADSRAGLPSVHSRLQLEFMLELGRAEGWFGPMKGVYLGGKILSDRLELVWSDGSPTDFLLWGEEGRRRKPGCVALFADLVFQHTRQAKHWEIHCNSLHLIISLNTWHWWYDQTFPSISCSSCDLRVKHSYQVKRVLPSNQTETGQSRDFVICKFNIHSGSGTGEPN